MLKKLFQSLFSKKEGTVSLKVSMEVELKMTPPKVETSAALVEKPKEAEKAESSKVQPEKLNMDALSYEEEIFLINVSDYQLGYLRLSGVTDLRYSFSIYLAESQICLTYRVDQKKWECFYNAYLWDHLATVTSYEVDREKLKYLTRTMDVRRVPYGAVSSLEQILLLIQKDFVSKSSKNIPTQTKKIDWEQWSKELAVT